MSISAAGRHAAQINTHSTFLVDFEEWMHPLENATQPPPPSGIVPTQDREQENDGNPSAERRPLFVQVALHHLLT